MKKNGDLPTYPRLRAFISGTALLHFAGFLVVASLGNDKSLPLYRSFQDGGAPATKHSGSISLKALIGSFFMLSAVFQGVPAAVPTL